MPQTRARPARDATRFRQLVAANIWFWATLDGYHAPNWRLAEEWRSLPDSTRIRRYCAANPTDVLDEADPTTDDPEGISAMM